MGQLYDAVAKINDVIDTRGLDAAKTKGELSLRSGFFLAIIFPETPDDAEKLEKLRVAARDVLNISV